MNQRTDIVPYELVYYGSEVLRKVAEPVIEIDQGIINLIESMFHVMHREQGNRPGGPPGRRVAEDRRRQPRGLPGARSLALINPEIIGDSGDEVPYEEGCLSIPGIMKEVLRPGKISVKGINPEGKEIQVDADGLLARVLQHEIDHVNGILFVDRLEDYIRKELTQELKKIKKLNKNSPWTNRFFRHAGLNRRGWPIAFRELAPRFRGALRGDRRGQARGAAPPSAARVP